MTTNQELIYRIMSLRAAENSLRDAITELSRSMPEGVEVLYCAPDKLHKPDTVYWTFRKRGEELSSTAMRGDEPGVKVMLLELPVDPRTLTLPRLPDRSYKPRYPSKCNADIFLGWYGLEDLYLCQSPMDRPIFRSARGENHFDVVGSADHPAAPTSFITAKKLAIEKGLIRDEPTT